MNHIQSKGHYTIYKHTGPTGLPYFGITGKLPEKRWKDGNGYASNEPFFHDIQLYGWDAFAHEIVRDCVSEKYSSAKEALLILQNDSIYPNGYNLQGGGKRGYKRSQYVRDKISRSLSKPIAQIDPETGNILKVWPSLTQAANELQISSGDISMAAHGKKRKTAGGYKWAYIEDLQAAGIAPAAVHFDEERKI